MNPPILERNPGNPRKKEINPLLKLALELGPLLVFFFANARGEWLVERFPALAAFGGPIFIATGLFMIATAVALAVSWSLTRTLPMMPLVSGVVVFVFGGLTLYLQDDVFIKMKPTIINSLFAAVLLGGLWFGKSLLGSPPTRRVGESGAAIPNCSSISFSSASASSNSLSLMNGRASS
jgi:intracellular septation protein